MKLSLLKTSFITIALLLPVNVMATAEIYTSFFSNLAVGGYDTVAFFSENMPVEGKSKFSFKYKDTEWRFNSQENLDLFIATPEKYAPQYGGYCAWLVAMNDLAMGDPQYWKIVDGKLYLNYDAEIKAKWLVDIPGFIKKANMNWPGVLN